MHAYPTVNLGRGLAFSPQALSSEHRFSSVASSSPQALAEGRRGHKQKMRKDPLDMTRETKTKYCTCPNPDSREEKLASTWRPAVMVDRGPDAGVIRPRERGNAGISWGRMDSPASLPRPLDVDAVGQHGRPADEEKDNRQYRLIDDARAVRNRAMPKTTTGRRWAHGTPAGGWFDAAWNRRSPQPPVRQHCPAVFASSSCICCRSGRVNFDVLTTETTIVTPTESPWLPRLESRSSSSVPASAG